AQQANLMQKNQEFMVKQIDLNRQSVSGVSLDEEMTNMLKYQKSYAASARVITAIDELLDTLINRMGIVGR
ncbi:MAG TPA: flagellar hook-associated protein FlgK, partial [Thermoanaerobacter sp.]|nr:flagellar hook-associated protein FlgK [Thermoanaerobacter sp.]